MGCGVIDQDTDLALILYLGVFAVDKFLLDADEGSELGEYLMTD
jgi:hypothetical protein